ncbi:uncharacterized protein N7515_005347 [Penicillium bovifimosum]|uniref:Uncharacterized protein n=1 Tax=Penicillium bovifimosum TaxID=126998 RepID=A0A9W9GSZ1_9EURO|nr:uncharacterized protein N7515_005347 [Penicillium bovifimosum]KAJ5129308.1 hypothetical protein N7515_005347 [Penicillium bovifimosum]
MWVLGAQHKSYSGDAQTSLDPGLHAIGDSRRAKQQAMYHGYAAGSIEKSDCSLKSTREAASRQMEWRRVAPISSMSLKKERKKGAMV